MTPTQRKAMQDATDSLKALLDDKNAQAVSDALESIETLRAALAEPAPEPEKDVAAYLDNLSVDRFAEAMKDKMAKQRAKGYSGWNTDACPTKRLQKMLAEHVGKGDPIDVGNIAMMLWTRKEPTAAPVREPLPLLTDEEISDIAIANPPDVHTYGRAIEQAARQKAGL